MGALAATTEAKGREVVDVAGVEAAADDEVDEEDEDEAPRCCREGSLRRADAEPELSLVVVVAVPM
jgi:hypothetical protein